MAKSDRTVRALFPQYYEKFACIGGNCEDNCCTGWRIDIDKRTYHKYKNIKDPELAALISQAVIRNKDKKAKDSNYAVFSLEPNTKRCRFMEPDGLCMIHRKLGPSYLSDICKTYPRLINHFLDDMIELSLNLSCPEALRIAVFQPEPMAFSCQNLDYYASDPLYKQFRYHHNRDNGTHREYRWEIREALIDIMQCRNLPINMRLLAICMLLKKLTELGDLSQVPQVIATYSGAVQTGNFGEQIANVPTEGFVKAAVDSVVYQGAIFYRIGSRTENQLYQSFYERYVADLAIGPISQDDGSAQIDLSKLDTRVSERVNRYWPDFLDKYSYLLENYFVNSIFSACLPFLYPDLMDLYHHGVLLVQQYAQARMLLCCLCDDTEGINDELLTKVFTSLALQLQNADDAKKICIDYRDKGLSSLAHMVYLLK